MESGLIWHQCLPDARPRCQPWVSGDTFMTSDVAELLAWALCPLPDLSEFTPLSVFEPFMN